MVYKAQLAKKRGQGESSTPGFVAVKILKGSWLIELVDQCNTSLSATFLVFSPSFVCQYNPPKMYYSRLSLV